MDNTELKLMDQLKNHFKLIEEEIEKATAPTSVKNLYELMAQASIINNLLCDTLSMDEYLENIRKLRDYKERENTFIFNFINKLMEEDKRKNWKAVFNFLLDTNFN